MTLKDVIRDNHQSIALQKHNVVPMTAERLRDRGEDELAIETDQHRQQVP